MSQDEYQRRALECMAWARLVKDPDQAALLLGMAQAWLRLADYALMFRDTADIAAIATPSLSQSVNAHRLSAGLRESIGAIRTARSAAISRNVQARVTVSDMHSRTVSVILRRRSAPSLKVNSRKTM